MRAGALNERITIQQQSTSQNAIGEIAQTWSDVATVWAEIKDITGREYTIANAAQNEVQTRIRIRYRDGLLPAMRAMHGSIVYNVQAVLNPSGAKDDLVLMCSKGVSNG